MWSDFLFKGYCKVLHDICNKCLRTFLNAIVAAWSPFFVFLGGGMLGEVGGSYGYL